MNNFVTNEQEKFKSDSKISQFASKVGFQHIVRNLPRSLLALGFTLSFSAFMTAMQAVTDNRAIAAGLHRQADDPLPDLLMDWKGAESIPMYTADLFLNSLIAFTIGCFLVSWRWRCQRYGLAEGHYRSFRLARKFLWMLGFAYLFRSFSLLSTTMPPTDPRCVYKRRTWKQIPFMALEIMTKQGNTCSDKIFSGHSSMATLICLFWLGALLRPDRADSSVKDTVPLWRRFAAVGIVTWTCLVYIFCVLCRNHYSIDIIVAILVCSGIFSTFQLSLKVIELGQLKLASVREIEINEPSTLLALPNLPNLPSWPNQHHYSPLKNDPEIGLDSPQISMTEIAQVEDTFKPPAHLFKETKTPHKSYVPRAFLLFLRAVAWMDGIDLKP